jgi:hypothetical protein
MSLTVLLVQVIRFERAACLYRQASPALNKLSLAVVLKGEQLVGCLTNVRDRYTLVAPLLSIL